MNLGEWAVGKNLYEYKIKRYCSLTDILYFSSANSTFMLTIEQFVAEIKKTNPPIIKEVREKYPEYFI